MMLPGQPLKFYFLCVHLICNSISFQPVAQFPPQETTSSSSSSFINVVIPNPTGDIIYVGATNYIFILDSNLDPLHRLETGPMWDHEDCVLDSTNHRYCTSFQGTNLSTNELRDNRNIALLVEGNRLIVCGTHRNGLCKFHSASDLREIQSRHGSYNVAYHARRFSVSNDSTVMFQGPGPEKGNPFIWMGAFKRLNKKEKYDSFIGNLGISAISLGDETGEGGEIFVSPISDKVVLSCEYNPEFIAAFGSSGFSYFLANMPAAIPSKSFFSSSCLPVKTNLISKIIQVCQMDPSLKSYVEVPISCSTGNNKWSILKAAALLTPGKTLMRSYSFSKLREKSEVEVELGEEFIVAVFASEEQPRSHAVCFYPTTWIRRIMLKNMRRCYTESLGDTGTQFPNSVKCKTLNLNVKEDFCRPDGCDDLEGPLSGTIGIESIPSLIINTEDDITSMTSSIVDSFNISHTLLFLGTKTGKLVKVLLETFNTTRANRIYKSAQLSSTDNTAVHKDIFFSKDFQYLFASTEQKVYKMPVSECEELSTCQECSASNDPLCGWCILENRCTVKSSCPFDGFQGAWLHSTGSKPGVKLTSERCPIITSMTPSIINLDSSIENITFYVNNLAAFEDDRISLKCSFHLDDRHIFTTVLVQQQQQLSCSLIDLKRIMAENSEDEKLGVKIFPLFEGLPRKAIKNMEFHFITCSSIKNCSSCTGRGSNPTCGWCSNRCTKMNRCPNTNEEPLRVMKKCPRITPQIETSISAGISKLLEIKAKNLPEKSHRGRSLEYFCKVEGETEASRATFISNSSVQCHLDPIAWTEKDPKFTSAQLFWKEGNNLFPVENVLKITVFNCSAMSHDNDCSVCQSLHLNEETTTFGCKWCQGGCRHSCPAGDQPECPEPKIREVTPLSGPMEGGTLVTMYGSNLGSMRNFTKVTIGNVECSKVDFKVSKRLVCRTNFSPVVSSGHPVKIQVDGKPPITSSFTFAYVRPLIHSIIPSFGPASGSTLVAIHGKDLTFDGGHDFQALVGSTCLLNRTMSNSSTIVCARTPMLVSPSLLPLEIPVSLKIDWANVSNEKVKFQVRGNPAVFNVNPPSTFKSGGCYIHAHGLNLNGSSSPIIKISGKIENLIIQPTHFNGTFMEFVFPVTETGKKNLMFIFDGVAVSMPFEVMPDPYIYHFNSHRDKHLVDIQGEDLLIGCRGGELNVKVGGYDCNITEVTHSHIACHLHHNISLLEDGEFQINVTLGKLELNPGSIHLSNTWPTISEVDTRVPILVGGIVGGLLIPVCLGILIMMKKISTSRKKNNMLVKRMQDLEKTISDQCKQSFAELQTHVSGFSSEISDAGIPYWDFKTYAFKFLFPMLRDHEVLRTGNMDVFARNERLNTFNQLLNNKVFFVIFIRTLEGHPKEFGIEDRSKIASWLTIVLLDKLEYATIVMKELMEDLIRKSLDRNTQKMMLRRTESVVEKMLSNWLCLTMYHYIKVEVGRSLFRLCKAIEYQVDDGPVDAITQESKFSLTEERLLRVKVDPLTLNVTILGTEMDCCGPVACKMFDCDTISQAKCKAMKALYKNKPYSFVPSPDIFELRLQVAGHECGVILRDDDSSSVRNHDWIQMNTLKHYNIKTGSTFILTINNKIHLHEHDNAAVWRSQETMLFDSSWGTLKNQEVKYEPTQFHLVRHDEAHNHYDGSEKIMSEVFLPRLIITKKALEDYVKKLYEAMMTCDSNLPPTIKYLFDFFDTTAHKYNITDPDVVHIWKSNSLPLRFWVSVLRNPDFVFDIEKSSLVDPCLAVIAQVFIDGCSTHKHHLGLDSSSAKLLFANEMQSYRAQVGAFYASVQGLPGLDRNSLSEFLGIVEREAENKFNTHVALQEVFAYATKFQKQIQECLDADLTCCSLKLPVKFHQLFS